jgi:hypothetical protein
LDNKYLSDRKLWPYSKRRNPFESNVDVEHDTICPDNLSHKFASSELHFDFGRKRGEKAGIFEIVRKQ